jgi:uncharacterized membrane protein YfcA
MFIAAVAAGAFGAMLGLGGGIILIPALTFIFDVPIKEAIAASLVSVVATSTSAAVVYVEKHLVNIRLGMTLEVATSIGALLGGYYVVRVSPEALRVLFAGLLAYTAYNMARKAGQEAATTDETYVHVPADATKDQLDDHLNNGRVPYTIKHLEAGMAASLVAGGISGLLGVGGGIIKVPVMRLAMGVPMRVAIATSNFMIGVTAATSALIYYSRGMISLYITAPAALGVLLGAQIGTRVSRRVNVRALTWLFVVMMIVTGIQMIIRAFEGG